MKEIALQSKDGKIFTIDREAMMISEMIRDMLEINEEEEEEETTIKEEEITLIEEDQMNLTSTNNNNKKITIPLKNIHSRALQKIVDYCNYYHKNKENEKEITKYPIKKPIKSKTQFDESLCEFDLTFLEMDQSLLIELLLATNYLNIKNLLDLLTCKIASMITNGKSVENLRNMFEIESDFTKQEEEKLADLNKWCGEELNTNYYF
ncbi:hypothetical protein ABK040_015527 [Willaertia magna]